MSSFRALPVLVAFATLAIASTLARAEAPTTKDECERVFKKEKAVMNACVEARCKGKDQQGFQECHSACALERSEKYQACYAKFVLEM